MMCQHRLTIATNAPLWVGGWAVEAIACVGAGGRRTLYFPLSFAVSLKLPFTRKGYFLKTHTVLQKGTNMLAVDPIQGSSLHEKMNYTRV